jgi:hypothetical protein
MKMQNFTRNKVFLLLCLIVIVINLLYPVTFTYDSGQYFSYFKILSGELSMENWDPVRGAIFPIYLKIITDLFGTSINSLVIPVIFFHLLLFFIASYFVINSFDNPSSLSKRTIWILIILVFAFIVVDPLIIGFYHAVLTEYVASTIALLSCLISYLLYKSSKQSERIKPVFFIIFSILVILAWHLKQPYIGAAIFPLFLVSLFLIVKQKNRNISFQVILGNIFVIFMLIVSIFLWDLILPNIGMAYNQGRNTSAFIDLIWVQNKELIKSSPKDFIKKIVNNYLALSNIYYYDQENIRINNSFSLIRANENKTIGYRLFVYGESNMAIPAEYPESYMENIKYYSSNYYPPQYLNRILRISTIKSTILFSISYLVLPFLYLIFSLFMMISKKISSWMMIIYLCSGSAFLNAVEHTFLNKPVNLNKPVDRYLFWGYPLLLICLLITIIHIFSYVYSFVKVKRQNSIGTNMG